MAAHLLDTNHLSDAIMPVSRLRDRIRSMHRIGNSFATTWPVLCELEAGILNTKSPERNRRTLRTLLKEVRIWSIDWEIVREFGRLQNQARSIGRVLSFVDLEIAAIARTRNAAILTTDKDFSAFPDLDVENWL